MGYRREIDGLRAFAVLPVVLFHAGFQSFSGGFVGVDVFFVISGYLITTIILAELEQGKFSIVNFYERRVRRILPALFVVMFISLPFVWVLFLPNDMKDFSKTLVAVNMFMSNILFWRESGYFDPAAELKPLLHTWSLSVEEQYYVVFPLFLKAIWCFSKRWVLVFLFVLALISLSLAHFGAVANPQATFYLLPARGWELLIGVFVAFYMSNPHRDKTSRAICELGGLIGFFSLLYAVFLFNKQIPFPSLYSLVPTVGTALIILYASEKTFVGRLLGCRLFVGIGLISYSIYLWHQPIFAFARHYTFNQVGSQLKVVLLALIFFLSYLTWRFVENPCRNKQVFSRESIFLLSVLGIVIFVLIGFLGYFSNGFLKARSLQKVEKINAAISDWGHPGELQPGDIPGLFVVDKSKPIDVLFFGDSHAEQYAPLASKLTDISSLNIAFLTGGGCPPIPYLLADKRRDCFDLFDRFGKVIRNNSSLKRLVVAGCFNCYFIKESQKSDDLYGSNYYFIKDGERLYFRQGHGQAEALSEFIALIDRLRHSFSVTVLLDNPSSYNFDPKVMGSRLLFSSDYFFDRKFPSFSDQTFVIPQDVLALNTQLQKKLAALEGINVIDVSAVVCPDAICKGTTNDGFPLYKDADHMRPFYVTNSLLDLILRDVLSSEKVYESVLQK